MDALAKAWNKYVRRAGDNRRLAFTGCCDEHDLFYAQGGSRADRAFADRILRQCIAENQYDVKMRKAYERCKSTL